MHQEALGTDYMLNCKGSLDTNHPNQQPGTFPTPAWLERGNAQEENSNQHLTEAPLISTLHPYLLPGLCLTGHPNQGECPLTTSQV